MTTSPAATPGPTNPPERRLRSVVGDATAKKLATLGLETIDDLLRHYPRRYVSLGEMTDLASLQVGQYATVMARVVEAVNKRFGPGGRKTRTEVTLTDGNARLTLTFFSQPWRQAQLTPGTVGLFAGEVGQFNGRLQLTHPLYEPAFEMIHRPRSDQQWRTARDSFRFEEAFVLQTVFAQRRHAALGQTAVPRRRRSGGLRDAFEQQLPFTLTDGQRAVVAEIEADLAREHPMHRLLQGEVGSGKTVVALLAMLQVVDDGAQAVLLAPTEVLAAQHHRGITAMLGALAEGGMLGGAAEGTRVRLLTGSMGAKARKEALLDAASGAAGIVVGTHAVLQETVQLAELGLLVVDEQHRFGVEQRAVLVDRYDTKPHVLVMTATPIPRTIAMTVFGDLETSTLSELPGGRQPIQTTVVPAAERPDWLARAWDRVREEVADGRQAYVVVSRIGDGDKEAGERADPEGPPTRSLVDLHEELAAGPLAGLRLGMLHGRQHPDEKDATMTAFARGEIDVLVATTVVEVGVDVPNATVMAVVDAERFGVSQLHQLRGRVGRGGHAGLCLLVTSAEDGSPSRERLDAVASTSDGFALSRLDAEQRREGDVLGAAQSGVRSSLRLLSVVKDEQVIADAREAATAFVEADPELTTAPDLRAAVERLEQSQQADYLERT